MILVMAIMLVVIRTLALVVRVYTALFPHVLAGAMHFAILLARAIMLRLVVAVITAAVSAVIVAVFLFIAAVFSAAGSP